MKLIVGIGNPGRQYAKTRHNVGWMICDRLTERYGMGRIRERFDGFVGEGRIGDEPVVLVKPTTFVNESGRCVSQAVSWYEAALDDMLVCCDDVHLPLGWLRVRRGGSSGGHNGLRSIIDRLGTKAFPRLRVGIDRPEGPSRVGHVLGRFRRSERPAAEDAVERAADAVVLWVEQGIDVCMNSVNAAGGGSPDDSGDGP